MVVPVFLHLAAITVLMQIAHQAGVVVLILARDAEVGVRSATEFAEEVGCATREEPEARLAVLVSLMRHGLHVAVRAFDAEHAGADLVELLPELLIGCFFGLAGVAHDRWLLELGIV